MKVDDEKIQGFLDHGYTVVKESGPKGLVSVYAFSNRAQAEHMKLQLESAGNDHTVELLEKQRGN